MIQLHFLRAAALGAALALCGATSHAQPAPDETPAVNVASAVETVDIRLNNAPVDLVAYWLDPARQKMPTQLEFSRRNAIGTYYTGDLPRQPGNGNGPRDLKLPVGIESIVAIDPTNILKVRGTAAGIEELKKLVVELDVPLRQVEVEAQFCSMSPQTLKALPLKFVMSNGAPSVALVPPTVSLSAELNKLIADNKVRIITAPRVTAIDGLTAQLTSTESIELALSPQAKKSANALEASKQWTPDTSVFLVETGLNCTPVLQGDLIKLFARATLNNRSVNGNTTLRDGETIAIAMPADKSDAAKTRTVIFLTARIIRGAGDETGAAKLGMLR